MKTENPGSDSESQWTKAPVANLIRYEPSGIYFARAKVRGKLIRKSLDTNILSVAKMRLADVLDAEHRAVAPLQTKIVGKMTFGDALAIFRERQKHATDIKDSTKRYNRQARAAYSYPWWASSEAIEIFGGQANEPVPIVPPAKYLAAAKAAMGREVFESELADAQALVEELTERVGAATIEKLKAKLLPGGS